MDQTTLLEINGRGNHERAIYCREDPHEVERLKVEVREMSLQRFAAVERHDNVQWQPREPMVYKIMRAR